MIRSLRIMVQNYKVSQYQDHVKQCFSYETDMLIRLKTSNIKYQDIDVVIFFSSLKVIV